MSFASELDVYGSMVSEGMAMKTSLMEEQSEQCLALLNQEHVVEKLVVGEEIVVGANGYLPDKIDSQTDANMYFEQNLDNSEEIVLKYEESDSSAILTETSLTEKWDCEDVNKISSSQESEPDAEEDEETIATFITAAGQQLALYAVENSDEVFAVALYDESGEPPTNFQFLMKTDVERLIGEGAVRTVKKPTQMKKRLMTTQPQVFYRKEDFEESKHAIDTASGLDTPIDDKKCITQEENCVIEQNCNEARINSTSSDIIYTAADAQSDITYLMMDDPANIAAEDDVGIKPSKCLDSHISGNELMERSTVQYILLEDEQQSDTELTFDEIQATLSNLKTPHEKVLKPEAESPQSDLAPSAVERVAPYEPSTMIKSPDEDLDFSASSSSTTDDQMCVSGTEDKFENERQRLIDTLADSPPSPPPSTATTTTSDALQPQLKAKRSRKQQLVSVDRDDGEIIIQPALMLRDEELAGKRRGRRRRCPPSQMRRGFMNSAKRMKRAKQREVEVIDLDADEEEQQAKRNIVEITLDDSKDKYSSDKENEIIMVRDSDSDNGDDEDEEEDDRLLSKVSRRMRCEHCSRNFRLRHSFETHLRVCQKSPANALRKSRVQIGKQYTCKICQEKFDVVVALARHVRAAHSQRRKHRLGFTSKAQDKSLRSVQQKEASTEEEEEEDEEDEEEEEEEVHRGAKRRLGVLARVKRKRRKRNTWEKKHYCADCGRWFPSTAQLDAHSLQHGTRKSEQRVRKCHVCQKLIRSRMLFLRHLKMHQEIQRAASTRIPRRKLRARPSVRKIAPARKRGRPRKF